MADWKSALAALGATEEPNDNKELMEQREQSQVRLNSAESLRIEEAIVYVMVKRNGGMTTDQIADAINRQRLHIRKDGKPVTSAQVYAVICRFPEMFTKEAGRIMLMI